MGRKRTGFISLNSNNLAAVAAVKIKFVKKHEKRKRDMKSLEDIIQKLVSKKPLDAKHRDHVLKGDYVGFRECHIENDWLLIYKIKDGVIYFTRTGTHSDLF